MESSENRGAQGRSLRVETLSGNCRERAGTLGSTFPSTSGGLQVCETGFNAGQSALIWLLANPKAKLYSFDLGQYGYTQAAAEFMAEKFPGRFTFIAGNSVESLPKFIVDHPEARAWLSLQK